MDTWRRQGIRDNEGTVDVMRWTVLVVAAAMFLVAEIFLVRSLFRLPAQVPDDAPMGSVRPGVMELIWTVLPAVLLLGVVVLVTYQAGVFNP